MNSKYLKKCEPGKSLEAFKWLYLKVATAIWFSLTILTDSGCKKLLVIPPSASTVTASQVFSSDAQAESAASGMYFQLINTNGGLSNYAMTVFGGMSADELNLFDQTRTDIGQFQKNSLLSTNEIIMDDFWGNTYSVNYQANAIIEGLANYNGVHESVKNELTGEAEFVRAFCNFYLVNLFGDIPQVTTINWHKTSLLRRTPSSDIYTAIIADLIDAQKRLAVDYSAANGQRDVPNKWAATALLARVYLYYGNLTGDANNYANAEKQATSVINNSNLYSLTSDLSNVFLANSSEAIWQLQQDNNGYSYNATPEGYLIIPSSSDPNVQPFCYLTTSLLGDFEPGDKRRADWIDSITYDGIKYYFPYKYKIGSEKAIPGGTDVEYYMVLRLAEQYLIRAEAEAHGAGRGLSGAISDLNVIRSRAGLNLLSPNLNQQETLSAVAQERRIEFFSEWGHRWLDLKRTGQAKSILSVNKGFTVKNGALLYPIPVGELQTDPNLTQNPGY